MTIRGATQLRLNKKFPDDAHREFIASLTQSIRQKVCLYRFQITVVHPAQATRASFRPATQRPIHNSLSCSISPFLLLSVSTDRMTTIPLHSIFHIQFVSL